MACNIIGFEKGTMKGDDDARYLDCVAVLRHPFGFSVLMAGAGLKGGVAHGATGELGFHAVENGHYVTDIHATVLHQLGLDPHRLEVPGHNRLEIDFGAPLRVIIA